MKFRVISSNACDQSLGYRPQYTVMGQFLSQGGWVAGITLSVNLGTPYRPLRVLHTCNLALLSAVLCVCRE